MINNDEERRMEVRTERKKTEKSLFRVGTSSTPPGTDAQSYRMSESEGKPAVNWVRCYPSDMYSYKHIQYIKI